MVVGAAHRVVAKKRKRERKKTLTEANQRIISSARCLLSVNLNHNVRYKTRWFFTTTPSPRTTPSRRVALVLLGYCNNSVCVCLVLGSQPA